VFGDDGPRPAARPRTVPASEPRNLPPIGPAAPGSPENA